MQSNRFYFEMDTIGEYEGHDSEQLGTLMNGASKLNDMCIVVISVILHIVIYM